MKDQTKLEIDVEVIYQWVEDIKEGVEGLEEYLKEALVDQLRSKNLNPFAKVVPLPEKPAKLKEQVTKKRKKPMSQAARLAISRKMKAYHKRKKQLSR